MRCSLFGKLPAKRDFIALFAPRHFLDIWEPWQQASIAASRDALKDVRVTELKDDWFAPTDTVLVTAGASAPEEHVQDCIEYLKQKFGATVETRVVREEDVSFPLPRELRVLNA